MLVREAVPALLIAALLAGVTWAWWLSGRSLRRTRQGARHGLEAQAALWRHPAGRARWPEPGERMAAHAAGTPRDERHTGPEDDPEFIRALEQRIRGEDQDPGA